MLREGVAPAVTHDEVVEQRNVHERERGFEPAGDRFVSRAGLQNSGRVIVRDDQ
jgi:hypothetical protein